VHPYFSSPGPHVLAHQGLALGCKPNSLEAFAAAIEAGADYIETDAHGTRDGVAVLFHDDELDGMNISSLLKAELPEYIPTLSSALARFPDTKFNIDIKNSEASEPVATEIITHSAQSRVLLTSFSSSRRKNTINLAPGTASSPGVGEFGPALIAAICGQQWLVTRYLRGFDAVQIPSSVLGLNIVSKRLVKMYHAAGVKVHVWTINDPEHMVTLKNAGVDGIVTDRTDLAVIALVN
jgi:glycerophosphoryl diester phosphodiesterase